MNGGGSITWGGKGEGGGERLYVPEKEHLGFLLFCYLFFSGFLFRNSEQCGRVVMCRIHYY